MTSATSRILQLDLSKQGKRNLWPLPTGQLAVRPGLRSVAVNIQEPIAGCFSVRAPYVGDVYHVLVRGASVGGDARIDILDDTFQQYRTLNLRTPAEIGVVTHGVVEGELMIGSPSLPTLWSYFPSDLVVASLKPGVTENTALPVPRGLCVAWQNRIVIANGVSLYVSDPVTATGGSPRTFTADNVNARPQPIFGLHVGAGGDLVACTSGGVFGLDPAAATTGTVGASGGSWRLLSHHQTLGFGKTCERQGRIYGLTMEGVRLIDVEDGPQWLLSEMEMPRLYGETISAPDWREARLFALESGPVVAWKNYVGRLDVESAFSSWWTLPNPADTMVGTLRDDDGDEYIVTGMGAVLRIGGNSDDTAEATAPTTPDVQGVAFAAIPTRPTENPTVRGINTLQAWTPLHAVNGVAVSGGQSLTRQKPWIPVPLVGSSSWGGSGLSWRPADLWSARSQWDWNTDDISLEVRVDGGLTRIGPLADVELSGSAPLRPNGRGN